MRFLLTLLLLAISLAGPSLVFADPPAAMASGYAQNSLLQLDQIISEAPDLDSFLNNPDLINRYFTALQKYYGEDKFSRDQFNSILKQLRSLVENVPQLKTRLWEKTNLGTEFEITTNFKTSGRALNTATWASYQTQWREQIQAQQSDFTNLTEEEALQSLQKTFADLKSEREAFEPSLIGLSKNAAEQALGNFLKSQRERPEVKQASAYLLFSYLNGPKAEQAFQTADADVILDFLDQIKKRTLDVLSLPEGITDLPSAVISGIKQLIPNNTDLLQNKDLFPYEMKLTRDGKEIAVGSTGAKTYSFDPLPRRIHGIWKGVSIGECVGGNSEGNLTPERWATVALKNTQLYHMHEGTSYLGFIQIVPIQKADKIYGSVDFGAAALTRKVLLQDERTRMIQRTTLFDLWFEKQRGLLPQGWSGLVVGSGQAINNAGVLTYVQESPKYRFGKNIGESSQFEQSNLAEKIVQNSPQDSRTIRKYGGRMIFDGMVQEAGTLYQLSNVDPNFLNNPRKLLAALTNGSRNFKRNVIRAYRMNQTSTADSNILNQLLVLTKAEDYEISTGAMEAIINNTSRTESATQMKTQLLQSGLLPAYIQIKYLDQVILEKNYSPGVVDGFLPLVSDPHLPEVTAEKVRTYILMAGLTPERARKILDAAYQQRFLGVPFVSFFIQQQVDASMKTELCQALFKASTSDRFIQDVFKAYVKIEKDPEAIKSSIRLLFQSFVNYGNTKVYPEGDPVSARGWFIYYLNESERKAFLTEIAPHATSPASRDLLVKMIAETDFTGPELEQILKLNPRFLQSRDILDLAIAKIPRSLTILDAAYLTYTSSGAHRVDMKIQLRRLMVPTSAVEEARLDQLLIWTFTNASTDSVKSWDTVNGIADFLGSNNYRISDSVKAAILNYVASIDKENHLYDSTQRLAVQAKANVRTQSMFLQALTPAPSAKALSCQQIFL